MADPKWDDTEEIQDIPSFEDTEEIIETQPKKEDVSYLETVTSKLPQSVFLGTLDEIGSGLLTPVKAAMEYIPGTPEYTDAQLREQGFTGDIKEQSLLDQYRELRDTSRDRLKEIQKQNPKLSTASEIAGGVLTTLATGGAGAAGASGQVASKGLPLLGKIALQGAVEGAVSAAGESEADLTKGEVGQFAEDVGTGAALGGAAGIILPAGAKVAGKALKGATTGAKGLVKGAGEVLGISNPISSGYKIGKKGLPLDKERISDALTEYSEDLILDIKKAMEKSGMKKSEVLKEIEGATEALDAGRTIEEVIEQVKNSPRISQADDISKLKTIKALEELKVKDAVSKAKARNERKLAKKAAIEGRKGGEVLTTTDFEKQFDEVIPIPETQGKVVGSEAKLKYPDGKIKKIITTETDELYEQLKQLTGRELDLSNMDLKDVDILLSKIKQRGGDLSKPTEDPIERVMRDLAKRIKAQRAKILEGDPRFLEETAKQRSIYEALEATPLKKEGAPFSFEELEDVSKLETKTSDLKKMLQQTGDAATEDQSLMFKKLDRVDPSFKAKQKDLKILQEGKELAAKDRSSGIFRSAQKGVGLLANVAGRASKKVGSTKPVEFTKNFLKMSGDQINRLSQFADSKASQLSKFSPILREAAANPDKKDVLLWTLSRQPGFREALKQSMPNFSMEEEEMQGE